MPSLALRLAAATIVLLSVPGLAATPVPQVAAPPAEPRPYFTEPSISPDRSEIAFVSGGDIWTSPHGRRRRAAARVARRE